MNFYLVEDFRQYKKDLSLGLPLQELIPRLGKLDFLRLSAKEQRANKQAVEVRKAKTVGDVEVDKGASIKISGI